MQRKYDPEVDEQNYRTMKGLRRKGRLITELSLVFKSLFFIRK